jgi:hypothetical protein
VGSRGDSYDNPLAESVIGLFKAEVIRRKGPWRTLEAVEFATLTLHAPILGGNGRADGILGLPMLDIQAHGPLVVSAVVALLCVLFVAAAGGLKHLETANGATAVLGVFPLLAVGVWSWSRIWPSVIDLLLWVFPGH